MSVNLTAPDEVLNRDEFASALRDQSKRYHDSHPFHRRMNDGSLSREEIQRWVTNRFYYQQSIPLKDAAILANCPEPVVRRMWVGRLLDHDGSPGEEGGIAAWLRLGEAVGVTREVLVGQQRVLPGVRFAVDAYVEFCRRRPWLEGVAASLTELFSPQAIRLRLAALTRHYPWIEPGGLEYFERRLEQAPRDAGEALELVLERCVRAEQQQRALTALQFKCDVLWAQLDAIERGDTRPG